MTTTPETDPSAVMLPIEAGELAALLRIKAEYEVTIRVVAILVERLLAEVGGDAIEISDANCDNPPDFKAWRDVEAKSVKMTIWQLPAESI